MPPFIIFAAKQINLLWTQDEVVGSRYAVSDNGWITRELFFYWLEKHFLQNAVVYHPILLLLNGHSSHFELKTIQLARQNNMIMFCLPPHTTHVCQPLDCSFFGPLKKSWQQECHHFYRKNPGKVTTREWLQCKCDRWIHEDYIDDEDCVITEGKLCLLC